MKQNHSLYRAVLFGICLIFIQISTIFAGSTSIGLIQNQSGSDTVVNYCKLIKGAYFYGQKSTESPSSLSADDVKYFNGFISQTYTITTYQTGIKIDEFQGQQRFVEGNRTPFPPSKNYHKDNPDTYLVFHLAKEIGRIKSPAFGNQCISCTNESIAKINALLKNTQLHRQVSELMVGPGVVKQINNTSDVNDLWLFLRCLFVDDFIHPTVTPFTINLKPLLTTPKDTAKIFCAKEIKPIVTVAWRHCDIGGKVDTIGPKLIYGLHNCPGALYRYKYVAKDQCLRVDSAFQFFTIENDPPTITCPPDTIVECLNQFILRDPEYTTSCNLAIIQNKFTPYPLLVKGTHNCPDAVYHVEHTVEDTCGRKATCIQKIMIDNPPPSINCPPDRVVKCEKDIKAESPAITISCKLDSVLVASPPKLVSGQRDCPGAIYEIKYTLTDACGRVVECVQKFTIDNPGPTIVCPDDEEVECESEINTGPPRSFTVSCELDYTITIGDPVKEIGEPNCPGTIYSVTYIITDACNRADTCLQYFTIKQGGFFVDCPDDKYVKCKEDIIPEPPHVNSVCNIHYITKTTGPTKDSGDDNCPGTSYLMTYEVIDSCGRSLVCVQTFTIANDPPTFDCPNDESIECIEDAVIPDLTADGPCGEVYPVDSDGPMKVSAELGNCPGALYTVIYKVKDDCGREVDCVQFFTIENEGPKIECPPNEDVDSEADIKEGTPTVTVSCDLDKAVTAKLPAKLVSGIPDCPGAVYELEYLVVDICGRRDSCIQKFTIKDRDIIVDCPPDVIIKCRDEIKPHSTTSWLFGPVTLDRHSGPTLKSGKENCPGAIYEIIYFMDPECDSLITCVQHFIIDNKGPEITCPPDAEIRHLNDAFDKTYKVEKDCELNVHVDEGPMVLISGKRGKPGSIYTITYKATDDCNRTDECVQTINLKGDSIPPPAARIPCDCLNQPFTPWSIDGSTTFADDVESLLRRYTIKELKAAITNDKLYDLWLSSETLGTSASYVAGIQLKDIFTTLKDMTKAIEVAEELAYGSSKNAIKIAGDWLATSGTQKALGTGSIAAVYTVIKTLHEFAVYMDGEIIELNLQMFANNYVDRDPDFFDVHHFLKTYAKVGTTSQINWNSGAIKRAIKSYAAKELNIDLGDFSDWNTDSRAYNFAATATNRFLHDVCKLYCRQKAIKNNLKNLIIQKELIDRYKAVFDRINSMQENDDLPDCNIANSSAAEISPGKYECVCDPGFKFSPDKTKCVRFDDCSSVSNSNQVFRGNRYECVCESGFKWDPTYSFCAPFEDCAMVTNAEEKFESNRYICDCINGFKWDPTYSNCVPADDCSRISNSTEVFRTDHYACDCLPGYKWNPSKTNCVPYQDCAHISNSQEVYKIDRYECDCLSGFQWNSSYTACESSVDCSAYPNTIAIWNTSIQAYECDCMQGYEWNDSFTACQQQAPDCTSFYPNTVAVWNASIQSYECDCISGYVWNATNSGCENEIPDCASFYPNSQAVYDAQKAAYVCDCIPGYEWNAAGNACNEIPPLPTCDYPNSQLMYDSFEDEYYCECIQGYKWNAAKTECVKKADASQTIGAIGDILTTIFGDNTGGNRDNPTVRPEQQKEGKCNVKYGSGANEPEQYTIDVYQSFGSVPFRYETFDVKDRIHVYYGNRKIFDSGCVGTNGNVNQTFNLDGFNTVFRIVIDPLCDPNDTNTAWNFTLGCPN